MSFPRLVFFFSLETRVVTIPAVSTNIALARGYQQEHMYTRVWDWSDASLPDPDGKVILAAGSAAQAKRSLAWVGAALVAINWISTATLQGPYHQQLSRGFDADIARQLVRTNWIRTVAWTARTVVGAWLIVK